MDTRKSSNTSRGPSSSHGSLPSRECVDDDLLSQGPPPVLFNEDPLFNKPTPVTMTLSGPTAEGSVSRASLWNEVEADYSSPMVSLPLFQELDEVDEMSALSLGGACGEMPSTSFVPPIEAVSCGEVSEKSVRRRRGRKSSQRTAEMKATDKTPRRLQERKVKLYEIAEPLEDEEMEKKRINAIRAKYLRDKQKKETESLKRQVESVTAERDQLRLEKLQLQSQLDSLKLQLNQQKEDK